jgi:acetyl esterase/lipase
MKILKLSLLFVLACILSLNLQGQEKVMKVWPDGIPGSIKNAAYSEVVTMKNGHAALYLKVTDPTITVFLPPAEKANGMAVVICPGGGYGVLAFDYEGTDLARWFNSNGIAGIVLKYRRPSDLIMENKSTGPLQDAQEALRIVRRNAGEWNINPARIGIMGFSAGGHLASTLSTHYADKVYQVSDSTSARPDFSLLIYPVISSDTSITHSGSMKNLMGVNPPENVVRYFSGELNTNEKTPPAFLVHSADDKVVPVKNSIVYFESLVKHHVPAELHVFQKGGHGFGLALNKETESAWPDLCLKWLHENFK